MVAGKVGALNPGPVVQSFDAGKRIELVVEGKLTREGVSALLEQARSSPAYSNARNKFEFRIKQRDGQSVLQLLRRGKWESFKGRLSAVFSFSTSLNAQSNRRMAERQQAATQLYELLEKPLVSAAKQRSEEGRWQQAAATRGGARAIARAVDVGLQPVDNDSNHRGGDGGPEVGRYVAPTMQDLIGNDNPFIASNDQHKSYEEVDPKVLNRNSDQVGKHPIGQEGGNPVGRGSLFGSPHQSFLGVDEGIGGQEDHGSRGGLFVQSFLDDDA